MNTRVLPTMTGQRVSVQNSPVRSVYYPPPALVAAASAAMPGAFTAVDRGGEHAVTSSRCPDRQISTSDCGSGMVQIRLQRAVGQIAQETGQLACHQVVVARPQPPGHQQKHDERPGRAVRSQLRRQWARRPCLGVRPAPHKRSRRLFVCGIAVSGAGQIRRVAGWLAGCRSTPASASAVPNVCRSACGCPTGTSALPR